MIFVTSDGIRLNILEAAPAAAPGAAIAFVPGWCMPAALWRAQLCALGGRFRVAALDPRGQGESELAARGYDIDRRADDIAEFVARYPGVVLVGWSLGALESLHYVHRHGDAGLAGLVLVDSSVGEDPAPPPATDFIAGMRRDRDRSMREFVRAMFRSPQPEEFLSGLAQSALRLDLEASLALLPRHLPREHWRGLARGFAKPLLYAVTPQFAAQARSLKQARPSTVVDVFAEAGHALFVDEPQRFNSLVAGFVDSILRPPAATPAL